MVLVLHFCRVEEVSMFMKRLVVSLASLFLVGSLATPASAGFLTDDGLQFNFYNLGLVAPDLYPTDLTADTYAIKVTLDHSEYEGATTDVIDSIHIGVGAFDAATLFSYVAPGTWEFKLGGLSGSGSDGCNENGAGMCAQGDNTAVLGTATVYEWVFHVDVTTALASDIHFKALWEDADGKKVGGLISEEFDYDVPTDEDDVEIDTTAIDIDLDTPVPEPGSLLLLGSGLVAAAARFRRRNQ